ncbi:MAG: hypothetical protein HOP12_09100 [Candidatus Eisenbacteria bacterium]|uniref:Uncharacterized protein n=1 Tax=Eiseniibacteriota bacterium TaxID=2212470 RepID=A0A849SIQ6_UNCEI|nr:hypothetical protein [Candidatus Eisenbacteria bacterium]
MKRGIVIPTRSAVARRIAANAPALLTRPRTHSRIASNSASGSLRSRVEYAFARRSRRERLALALLLRDRLRPVEVAVVLGVSVRQVERTLAAFLTSIGRVQTRSGRVVSRAPERRAA